MDVYDAGSLPSDDNVNAYAFCLDLAHDWFLQKGAMIAYYGNARFDPLSALSSAAAFVAARFSSPVYVQDWVVASGSGKVVVADRGFDVNSFDLEDGNLTVRAGNLLAFDSALQLQQSIVPGFLTLLGTGRFIASSNGPVVFVEPPFRADPRRCSAGPTAPALRSTSTRPGWPRASAACSAAPSGGLPARSGSTTSPAPTQCCSSPASRPATTPPPYGWSSSRRAQLLSPTQAGQLAATLQARARPN